MFGFSYVEGGPWDDGGIKSIAKFVERIERIVEKVNGYKASKTLAYEKEEKELLYAMHYSIKCVDREIESFSFNTAVARVMEFVNALFKYDSLEKEKNVKLLKECINNLLLLIAPLTPHFAEELWSRLGNKKSIFNSSYPVCEERYLVLDETEYGVQINSKLKTRIVLSKTLSNKEIEETVLADEKIKQLIEGKTVVKTIIIPLRLVNIIVK
jgi:leucyl-tRNA synthetase